MNASRARVATTTVVACVALVLAIGAGVGPAHASTQTESQPLQTVVVKMAGAPWHAASVMKGMSASAPVPVAEGRYVLRVPANRASDVLSRLRSQPGVSYAEVAQRVHATASPAPNDPCYVGVCDADGTPAAQQYLRTIGAPSAWNITHGILAGRGITVAVLDSGVDTSQPDLSGKVVGNVNVCTDDDTQCAGSGDPLGHGTHVAGILAADTNNLVGVASLGWGVNFVMFKVLDSQGEGNTADVATAIIEAVNTYHVRVINMSFANFPCSVDPTDCGPSADLEAAINYALAHNVVVVAAAGNGDPNGTDQPTYPGSFPGVLSVAATDDNGVVEPFSEWGPAANIAAPGLNIVSTWPNALCTEAPPCYQLQSGTSEAAPEVAAAAALMIAHAPALSGPQITELLQSTARPVRGGHPINGGVLDVPAALAAEASPPRAFNGYDLAGSDGSIYNFGSTLFLGDLRGHALNRPVVGLATASNGLGYWVDASDGGVFAFGDAGFYGSTGNVHLNKPVVGMAATPDGRGYWLVASDGGVFSFGDASFHGSTGNVRLVKPVVGMAATPDGRGYWLVASDGGVFSFGDASFHGSTGNVRLVKPVVGMAATPDGRGYWLVASDGGVFAFGDAGFYGSTGNVRLVKPVVGMAATPDGRGYWLVASDGGVFAFGDARFYGSTGGQPIPAPVVGADS